MTQYKLTVEQINNEIDSVSYTPFGETGMLCVITLKNGYTVTGESGCIDPTIFDAEIGKKVAYENAFNKLWAILGYGVKQRWYEDTRMTWVQRVEKELAALDDKRTKLAEFLSKSRPAFVSEEQWVLMQKQEECMSAYAMILQERLIDNRNKEKN